MWRLIIVMWMIPSVVFARKNTSIKSGYWYDVKIWSKAEVPTMGDSIYVNHVVGSDSTIVLYKSSLFIGDKGKIYTPQKLYIDKSATVKNNGSVTTEELVVYGEIRNLGELHTGGTLISGLFVNQGDWVTKAGVALNWQENLQTERITACSVFPNPSNGTFKISFEQEVMEGYASITDLTGRIVFNYSIKEERELAIQLDLPPGMYYLTILIGTEKITETLILK